MRLFGITGGIGMGKSTAADLLRQSRVPVVDTDAIARKLVEPGQPALEEIIKVFGKSLLGSDGRLRRQELAQLVFSDSAARSQLESILHPCIRADWLAEADRWRADQRPVGVVIIPLLFETDAQHLLDTTLCVACSSATQLRRLAPRGWTRDQIEQRKRAQWSVEKKMAASDYVVWTEGSLEVHAEQLRRIVRP